MKDEDKTELIRDLERRIACVREAGGSVHDGSAKDGYADIQSLRVMLDIARARAHDLAPIEAEFSTKAKAAAHKADALMLWLRDEGLSLHALIQEAKETISKRIAAMTPRQQLTVEERK